MRQSPDQSRRNPSVNPWVAVILLFIGLATSDLSPYRPRGWRPNGQRFNPGNNRLQTHYGPPGLPGEYGPPEASSQPPVFTTTVPPPPPSSTAAAPATTTLRTASTPRSREPTTPSTAPEEDFDSNPALAIANSFAFNRPVYVYNSFPFLPGTVLVR